MSLTEMLARPEVAAQFNKHVRLPCHAVISPSITFPLVHCTHQPYALVGTAFDYCMRFCLAASNPDVTTNQIWIAEIALEIIEAEEEMLPSGVSLSQARKGVERARELYQTFLQTKVFTRPLARASLFLAALDRAYRNGPTAINASHLKSLLETETDDLMRLVNAIPRNVLKADKRVVLNPSFGRASELVDGADADYIIDDLLVDIKTTKSREITSSFIHQLVGYRILISTLDGSHPLNAAVTPIIHAGVYFSRHSHLYRFSFDEIIAPASFEMLARWFISYAMRSCASYLKCSR